ncbi:MAG: PIN domain-containing protein [bacterium]
MGEKALNRLKDLAGRQGVVIDTMIFIYLFEAHPVYADRSEEIIGRMSEGSFSGVVTPITAAELLVKPLKQRRPSVADRYRNAIRSLPNVTLPDIDTEVAFLAGSLKAKYGMPLPDMFQAAMALCFPAQTLITNDRAMRKVKEISVFLLDERIR